jgi:hypothetical protein
MFGFISQLAEGGADAKDGNVAEIECGRRVAAAVLDSAIDSSVLVVVVIIFVAFFFKDDGNDSFGGGGSGNLLPLFGRLPLLPLADAPRNGEAAAVAEELLKGGGTGGFDMLMDG